jgi:hypothetical protein
MAPVWESQHRVGVLNLTMSQVSRLTSYCQETDDADCSVIAKHYSSCLSTRVNVTTRSVSIKGIVAERSPDSQRALGMVVQINVRGSSSWRGRVRGTHEEPPRHSVVPRRVKTIEEVILLWRHGDPSKGSEYPLQRIQTAADRKIVIQGYTNAWWEKFGHKDAMSRYMILVKGVVSTLEPGRMNMREAGRDVDWEAALALFHNRWDRQGRPQPMTVAVSKLRSEQNQSTV